MAPAPAQGPSFDIWYGKEQSFGERGQPQRWVNILGRVSDPDGVSDLRYRLNGGNWQALSIGPNFRRLEALGDFNAEIAMTDLLQGDNTVELSAVDQAGQESRETVQVAFDGTTDWPLPYSTDWSEPGVVEDHAQVVDGHWVLDNGARPVQWGYDRLLAIGDLSWTDYEVVAEFTVHAIQDVCLQGDTCSGGPAVGMIVRWTGHYAWDDSQPRWGWHPMGAMGLFFYWRDDVPNGKLSFFDSDGDVQRNPGLSLPLSTPYMMKMRAETIDGVGHEYRLKFWPKAQPEPASWQFVDQQPQWAPDAGGVLLVVHHLDATIGPVSVVPVGGDEQAPSTPQGLSATALSTSRIALEWQAASDNVGVSDYRVYRDGEPVASVPDTAYTDTGLAAATAYRYAVSARDAMGNESPLSESLEVSTLLTGNLFSDGFEGGD